MIKPGDKLYIPTSLHISRGSDDVQGGLATVKAITNNSDLPDGHYNKSFVYFEEVPGTGYNLRSLLENQEKLKAEFGDQIAHPDPDVDTPWIERGDIVNGEKYDGPPIW